MSKIDKREEENDQVHYYRIFAVLLKRQSSSGALLFFFDKERQEFCAAETSETMSIEDIKTQFVKMVWYLNDGNIEDEEDGMVERNQGEDRMEMV